jgi:hypothetical protein
MTGTFSFVGGFLVFAMIFHIILRLYFSCIFGAVHFYEIEDQIFPLHVDNLSSTSYGFPYHSIILIIHTVSVY